jgi:nucleoside phosphorylase
MFGSAYSHLSPSCAEFGWEAPEAIPCLEQLPLPPGKVEMSLKDVRRELCSWGIKIVAMVLVVNDRELEAVMRRLVELKTPRKAVYQCFDLEQKQAYRVGLLGQFPTVVVQTAMGQGGMIREAQLAMKLWKPKVVFNVGVAWGVDPETQKMGDLLVSQTVAAFADNMKIAKGSFKVRNRVAGPSDMLEKCVQLVKEDWAMLSPLKWDKAWYPPGDKRRGAEGKEPFAVHMGKLFSGGILLNDKKLKQGILSIPEFEDVIGGEMEGYGLHLAAEVRGIKEWIVVKGICDWGCAKEDDWQRLAAATAADFVFYVLNGPHLEGMIPKRELIVKRYGKRRYKGTITLKWHSIRVF